MRKTKTRNESNETRYRKALEFIVANSLHQNAWYVDTALNALGKEHPYYKEIKEQVIFFNEREGKKG